MTFEKVLEVFKDNLAEDINCEVVLTKHGYTVMQWDENLLGYTDRDLLDVTDLSIEQRNSVQEIISTYRKFNEAMGILHENDLYITEDPCLLTGSTTLRYQKDRKNK